MNTKPPPERESKVQRSIMIRLHHRFGIRLWRRNVGGLTDRYGHHVRFAAPGQADLWGVMPASHGCRHVEIETKRPGEKPTEHQLRWLKYMHDLGCISFWSDSANDAERVAEAVLNGGQVVWHENEDFHIEMQ